jgi:hypothetical protein
VDAYGAYADPDVSQFFTEVEKIQKKIPQSWSYFSGAYRKKNRPSQVDGLLALSQEPFKKSLLLRIVLAMKLHLIIQCFSIYIQ